MTTLRWGILSTGIIARRLAKALQISTTGRLQAVASRDGAKARAFAEEFAVPQAHGSYDELLANPEVDVVYIATPHPQHAEWAIKAAQAKKHILCEKPAAMNHAEAAAMIAAAREHGVFFLEAFMYRCHPQTLRLVELIRQGALGEIGLVQCSFGFASPFNAESRLFARELGGGGILDIGCYCMSMARLVAGAAVGADFADPLEIKAVGIVHPTVQTDMVSTAVLKFPGGVLAQLNTAMRLTQENVVSIYGSKGILTVTQPWFAGGPGAKFLLKRHETGATEEILTETAEDLYSYELDLTARHCQEGQAPSPAMTWADTLGNMQALDRWRAEIGVTYAADAVTNLLPPGPDAR